MKSDGEVGREGILDISMLPLPKSQMKQVLKGLYAKEKRTDLQKYLENGFLYLSQFQEGVGDKLIDGKLLDGELTDPRMSSCLRR